MRGLGIGRLAAALLAVAAAVLIEAPSAFAAAPKVVVTIKPVHAIVSAIMLGAGSPALLVEGSASPHTFTLKPSGAKAINEAHLFIRVGESLEPFTRKIAAALPSGVKLLTLIEAPGMTLLDRRQSGTFEPHLDHDADEHHDDHDDADAKDGHIWLDPENAKVIASVVAGALSQIDPEDAALFEANRTHVTAKIDAMTSDIAAKLQPLAGKPFVVFHDAYHYFEKRFGLAAAGSVTISPDVQPSAKRLSEVRDKIISLGAACVFSEPSFQPNLIAAVIEGTNAKSGQLDPEGALSAPGPDLYGNLMQGLAANFKACFDQP